MVDYNYLKDKIINWFNMEGLMLQVLNSEKDHFLIRVNFPKGSKSGFLIFAPKDRQEVLGLESALKISSEGFSKAYENLSPKQLEDFKYDFYKEFYKTSPHVYLRFDKKTKYPEKFVLMKWIWFEGDVGRREVMSALDEVYQITESARYFCLKYFDIHSQAPESRQSTNHRSEETESYIR